MSEQFGKFRAFFFSIRARTCNIAHYYRCSFRYSYFFSLSLFLSIFISLFLPCARAFSVDSVVAPAHCTQKERSSSISSSGHAVLYYFFSFSLSLSRFLPRRYIKSRMRTLAIRTRSVSSIVWILFARVCVHARSIVIANCDTRCAEFHCTRNNCLNAFSLATYNGEPTCSRIIIINNRSKKNTIIVKTRNSTLEIFAHVE